MTLFVGESRLEAANFNLVSGSESWDRLDRLAKGDIYVGEKESFLKEIPK